MNSKLKGVWNFHKMNKNWNRDFMYICRFSRNQNSFRTKKGTFIMAWTYTVQKANCKNCQTNSERISDENKLKIIQRLYFMLTSVGGNWLIKRPLSVLGLFFMAKFSSITSRMALNCTWPEKYRLNDMSEDKRMTEWSWKMSYFYLLKL